LRIAFDIHATDLALSASAFRSERDNQGNLILKSRSDECRRVDQKLMKAQNELRKFAESLVDGEKVSMENLKM
jgi:hypothetical protein